MEVIFKEDRLEGIEVSSGWDYPTLPIKGDLIQSTAFIDKSKPESGLMVSRFRVTGILWEKTGASVTPKILLEVE